MPPFSAIFFIANSYPFLAWIPLDEYLPVKEIAEPSFNGSQSAAKAGDAVSDFAPLEAAVAADENNLEARFELAMAYFAAGQKEEAMAQLLESIRRDRDHNEGAAKTQLLEFFEAIGVGDAMVIKARRKLSSYLFS